MYYKNISNAIKTFYGVRIAPGEIQDIPGTVNDISLIRVNGASLKRVPEEPPRQVPVEVPNLSEAKVEPVIKRKRMPKAKSVIEAQTDTNDDLPNENNDFIKEEL